MLLLLLLEAVVDPVVQHDGHSGRQGLVLQGGEQVVRHGAQAGAQQELEGGQHFLGGRGQRGRRLTCGDEQLPFPPAVVCPP